MEIYIKVSDIGGFGGTGWYYKDDLMEYLMDSFEDPDTGEILAIPAKSVKEAKAFGKAAKALLRNDGASSEIKTTYWKLVDGEPVAVKFTADGKIKK